MITWMLLDKSRKEAWLPGLFDLLYENMRSIAPTGFSYEMQKESWICEVSPALDKAPRQILMCLCDGKLIGYLQYYTRGDLLVIEEMQVKKEFQRTTLFWYFCKQLLRILPGNITTVEAYADKRNTYSQMLMRKLNMQSVAPDDAPFLHFRGTADDVFKRFR